jgi:divinyl chlorophyllide a 8-vinyl-reductase
LQQGQYLFELMGQAPRFKRVPVGLLDAIIATLSVLGKLSSTLADKAELARIGRYYATESMLVWDEKAGRYDADATPSTGSDTLWQHYQKLVSEGQATELGDHSVF